MRREAPLFIAARWKKVCVAAVKSVHAHKVLHGDLHPEHFCLDPSQSNAVCLIDFDRSQLNASTELCKYEFQAFVSKYFPS